MDNFGDIGCSRAATLSGADIGDVSLTWLEGRQVDQGQLLKVQLTFSAARPLSNLGTVIRIFDQAGRCAFSSRHTDLDESFIGRSLSSGRHVVMVHLVAALPVGWYALSFALAENPSGKFAEAEAWKLLVAQTCYAPFYVGDAAGARGEGYCRLPITTFHVPFAKQATDPGRGAFTEFPWPVNQPGYSLAQVVATLQSLLPGLSPALGSAQNLPAGAGAVDLHLRSGYPPVVLPATHPGFSTKVGRRTDQGMVSGGEAGALLFGPYLPAQSGRYAAAFSGTCQAKVHGAVKADVVAERGTRVLGSGELSCADDLLSGVISFVVPEPGVTDLEFRVFVAAGADLAICQVVLSTSDEHDPLRLALRDCLLGLQQQSVRSFHDQTAI